MGSEKLNNGENPPASASLVQVNDEFAFTNRQNYGVGSTGIFHNGGSAGADPMFFPYMPFPIDPFPWKHMHGTYQPYTYNIPETCGNLMGDLTPLHKQNPLIDLNSLNVGSIIPSLCGQDLQCPEGKVNGVSCPHDKTGTADVMMNDTAYFNDFQKPEINRNFALIGGNVRGGYEITRQGGPADISNIHGPQMKNFFGLEGSTNMLYNTQNSGEISIETNDEVCAAQFVCPKKIDGSFLSLGIGGNTDAKSKYDLSSRGNTGELNGAVSLLNTSHVRQVTGSSLNLGHNLAGGFPSFQNNVGGFTSLGHHTGGRTSSNYNAGVMCGTNAGPNSSQFHILQKPQADMQCGFPTSSTRSLGIVGDRDARYANLDPYKGFIGELDAYPGPYSSNSAGLLDSGQTVASGLASESVKLSWTTTQPTSDQLQKRFMETVQNFSSESSMVSSFLGFRGSFTRQERSGQLFPAPKDSAAQAVDDSAPLPRWKHAQPAGQQFSASDGDAPCGAGGGLFPKRIGVQVSKDSAAQGAGSGLFPQRLGVQVNEHGAAQADGDDLFPKRPGIQLTNSRVGYAAECGVYPKDIGVQTASKGCSQESLPIHFSKDLLGPASTTGQVISTAQGYGHSRAANVLGGPSLKRSASRLPPAAPQVQRRKITFQPPINPSMPLPLETAPAARIPITAPVPHIKWEGLNRLPQATGQKCMLCKRDLSFTTEGPIYQPTVPPAVAVLPCGHTFHDHCLQIITPADQSKNPPCIPCAIGEI